MSSRCERFFSDADVVLAGFDNTFVVVWRNRTTIEGVRALCLHMERFAVKHGHSVGLITIVEPNAPILPRESREAIADFLGVFSKSIVASALVFEGTGFGAAAVRSVVATMILLGRPQYSHRIFSTVDKAAQWIAPRLRVTGDSSCQAEQFAISVEEIRRWEIPGRGSESSRNSRGFMELRGLKESVMVRGEPR